MRRQVSQQLQDSGHLKDTLLAIVCRRQTDQQSEPEGQEAHTTYWRGLRTGCFGHWHWEERLKKIILKNHKKKRKLLAWNEHTEQLRMYFNWSRHSTKAISESLKLLEQNLKVPLVCLLFSSCTFCRMPLQSRDAVRLTRREKARFWMGLLSEASEVSFMTECIRELLEEPLEPGTPLGLLLHTELHAGNRKKYSNDALKN